MYHWVDVLTSNARCKTRNPGKKTVFVFSSNWDRLRNLYSFLTNGCYGTVTDLKQPFLTLGPRTLWRSVHKFYIQSPVHTVICGNNYQTGCINIQFISIRKLFYMFQVVSPLYLQYLALLRPLLLHFVKVTGWELRFTVSLMRDTVDTVTRAADDEWRYNSKYVEQFAVINKLCIVSYCWIITATSVDKFPRIRELAW